MRHQRRKDCNAKAVLSSLGFPKFLAMKCLLPFMTRLSQSFDRLSLVSLPFTLLRVSLLSCWRFHLSAYLKVQYAIGTFTMNYQPAIVVSKKTYGRSLRFKTSYRMWWAGKCASTPSQVPFSFQLSVGDITKLPALSRSYDGRLVCVSSREIRSTSCSHTLHYWKSIAADVDGCRLSVSPESRSNEG